MSNAKVSTSEQKALREKARQELVRMENIFKDQETIELLERFKNYFNICETVYKVILAAHQKSKGKKTGGYLKLDMKQVPYALQFAGYSFEKNNLKELFGASGERGTTVKKLRDAITHGVDPRAVDEIVARQVELFELMESFLSTIRTADIAA